MTDTLTKYRRQLLEIAAAALGAVDGRMVVRRQLEQHPAQAPVVLIAIGKAAPAMALGALDNLGDAITQGLIITKDGHTTAGTFDPRRFTVLESGHPLPDARSLAAGGRLLSFLAQLPRETEVIFLISGGTSALVDVLRPGVTLPQLQRVNDWLLGSGWDIDTMNAVRQRLSEIKGGGLCSHLGGRRTRCLLISDVRGNDPAVIGSGLLYAPSRSMQLPDMPGWLRSLLAAQDDSSLAGVVSPDAEIVATLEDACAAAERAVVSLGHAAYRHSAFVDGDALQVGTRLAHAVLDGECGVHIWGGETTMVLPPEPGRGGRNQALALAAAVSLQGRHEAMLLSLATDGSDGPGGDAGALVDGGTVARIRDAGYDAALCSRQADSGSCLAASGDLIDTGPTGTNVMDLMLGLKLAQVCNKSVEL